MSDEKTDKEAIEYIKKHKNELIDCFANIEKIPFSTTPFTFFMAGSPGAGKTETSRSLVNELEKLDPPAFTCRIDADEIKTFIPHYNGKNSNEIQGASALGVQKLYDRCLSKKQPALIDGTFSDYNYCIENVERSVSRGRKVGIIYIYQDPIRAWELTKARGKKEGRHIPMDFFVDAFFASKENAQKIKTKYGDKVWLAVVKKDYNSNLGKAFFNVDNIDSYIKMEYDKDSLFKALEQYEKENK